RESQTLLRRRKSLLRRVAPPEHGERVVFRDAAALVIRAAEARLRIGEPVFGGALPPGDRLLLVALGAATFAEQRAETVWRGRVAALGRLAVPHRGFHEVLLHAGAALIERRQSRLRRRIALLGEWPQNRERCRVVGTTVRFERLRQCRRRGVGRSRGARPRAD